MPYIDGERRAKIADAEEPQTVGELNYAVTRLVTRYLGRQTPSYIAINDVVGVLESVKLELYRRVAAPYEDIKRRENGDVYSV